MKTWAQDSSRVTNCSNDMVHWSISMAVIDIIIMGMREWTIAWLLLLSRKILSRVIPTNWHFIWHTNMWWHLYRIWYSFWHSIWYMFWHSIRHSLWIILSDICSGILSGMCSGPGVLHSIPGWQSRRGKGGRREEEGLASFLESRDPHLAGCEGCTSKGCSGESRTGTAVMKEPRPFCQSPILFG